MVDENGFETEESLREAFERLKEACSTEPEAVNALQDAVDRILNHFAAPDTPMDCILFETLQEVFDWTPSEGIERFWKKGEPAT